MNDLADYKRTNNKKKYVKDFVEGILDVIETDYPDKYIKMFEDHMQLASLFSNEEWIDILTKSRNSYICHTQRIKLTRKHLVQENRSEIGRLIMLNSHLERNKSDK